MTAAGPLAAVLALLPFSAPALAQESIDLDTIRAALRFYSTGITSLEGRFSYRRIDPPHPEGVDATRYDFAMDCLRGRTYLSAHGPAVDPEGRPSTIRSVAAFDGELNYMLGYAAGLDLDNLMLSRSDATTSISDPAAFAGLRLRFVGGSLADAFELGTPRIVGPEDARGTTCWRVDLGTIAVGQTEYEVGVWLDPEHDFLPRRIAYRRDSEDHAVLETLEYSRFQDQRSGNSFWFPVRAVSRSIWVGQTTEIAVEALHLNGELPLSRFQILPESLPDGILVHDVDGRQYFTGDREDLWQERQRLRYPERYREDDASSAEFVSSTETVRAAQPSPARWLPWIVAGASVIMIGLGGWMFWQRRHRG